MSLVITTSLPPNLFAHIYAASGLIGMKKYQEKYYHTLRKEDIAFLESMMPVFEGRPPMGGPLFLYLYQIPSYFPAETLDEVLRNMEMIIGGLETDWIFFKELDEDTLNALEVWIPHQLFEYPSPEITQNMMKQVIVTLNRLMDIITYCHRDFYKDHWKALKPALLKRAEEIQRKLEGLSVFEAWSEALGLSFPYKEYVFFLCEARQGGTSLLAEKFALPYNVTLERQLDTILHEVGIHFIIRPGEYFKRGLTVETFIQRQEEIGRMEEAATCFFKSRVYESLGLELKEDYHLPLMRIEPEIRRFSDVWENESPSDAIEGLLIACHLI